MGVPAVASVDNRFSGVFVHQLRASGRAVADAIEVDAHRVQCIDRVLQAFAFLKGGNGGLEADHVRTEAAGGKLKAHPGAGAVFHKEGADSFAAQGGDFFVLAEVDLFHSPGCFQNIHDFFRGIVIQVVEISSYKLR